MDTNWREIIGEALQQGVAQVGGPVAGAKLRTLVDRSAKERGVEFPPPEMRTFSSFLESFPGDFIVQRRPGRDVLVAPAGRPELLAEAKDVADSTAARLRSDLFEALTRIPNADRGRAFYSPTEDAVHWLAEQEPGAAYIAFPATSDQAEIQVRRDFAQGLDDVQLRRSLAASLDSASPLRDFTAALHATGLVMEWHRYRLANLISRLKDWASTHGIQWQSGWVESSDARAIAARAASVTRNVSSRDLLKLVSALSEGDIARINVPLDIVLRLISRA